MLCVMPLDEIIEGLDAGALGQAMHVASVLLANRLLDRLPTG